MISRLFLYCSRNEKEVAKWATLILAVIVVSVLWAIIQNVDDPPKVDVHHYYEASPAPLVELAQENDELEALLAIQENNYDRMLSLVSWSLAAILGMGLLLVGFNWFNNSKMTEVEKRNLSVQLEDLKEQSADAMAAHADIQLKLFLYFGISQLRAGNLTQVLALVSELELWLNGSVHSQAARQQIIKFLEDIVEYAEPRKLPLDDEDFDCFRRLVNELEPSSDGRKDLIERARALSTLSWETYEDPNLSDEDES